MPTRAGPSPPSEKVTSLDSANLDCAGPDWARRGVYGLRNGCVYPFTADDC